MIINLILVEIFYFGKNYNIVTIIDFPGNFPTNPPIIKIKNIDGFNLNYFFYE